MEPGDNARKHQQCDDRYGPIDPIADLFPSRKESDTVYKQGKKSMILYS